MFKRLDTPKAVQAIGVLLMQDRSRTLSKMRVLKLLYIAERECIGEFGRPLLGARTVAMPHGPLHSGVLDLINGQHIDAAEFTEHFSRFGYQIAADDDPGVSLLSPAEIAKLREVSDRHASDGDWSLAHDTTHKFKEWLDNYEEGASTEIPMEDIIEAVGRGDDKAAIISDLKDSAIADSVFGVASAASPGHPSAVTGT